MEVKLNFTANEIRETIEKKGYEIYLYESIEESHVHGSRYTEYKKYEWRAKKAEIDLPLNEVFQNELKSGILSTINKPMFDIAFAVELVKGLGFTIDEAVSGTGLRAIDLDHWLTEIMEYRNERSQNNEIIKKESKINTLTKNK